MPFLGMVNPSFFFLSFKNLSLFFFSRGGGGEEGGGGGEGGGEEDGGGRSGIFTDFLIRGAVVLFLIAARLGIIFFWKRGFSLLSSFLFSNYFFFRKRYLNSQKVHD